MDNFATGANPLAVHERSRPINIPNHALGGLIACSSLEIGLVLQTQHFVVLINVLDVSTPFRSSLHHLSSSGRPKRLGRTNSSLILKVLGSR